MITHIVAFLVFPLYGTAYVIGFLFDVIKYGFDNGRKGLT